MLLPSGICTSTRTSGRSEVGKNCCLTDAHADAGEHEHGDHGAGDEELVADRPADQPAEPPVVGRGVDRGVTAGDRLDLGQQLHAEIGREGHRDDPGGDQREADDPEDVAGIFAGARLGEADRASGR